MPPYLWSMLGLSLDICGAFLVAVEAIKLDNFRRLRDQFLPTLTLALESPLLRQPEDTDEAMESDPAYYKRNLRRGFGRHDGLFLAAHYAAGIIVVLLVNIGLSAVGIDGVQFLRSTLKLLDHIPLIVRDFILVVVSALMLIGGLWGLGEVVHESSLRALRIIIRALDIIDRRTPDGSIGILGFVLLFVGFLGQMYGSWKGGHTQIRPPGR